MRAKLATKCVIINIHIEFLTVALLVIVWISATAQLFRREMVLPNFLNEKCWPFL